MAKKKINIVLILVVLGLWGSIIYKTVYKYIAAPETVTEKSSSSHTVISSQINKDTFSIKTIARDPFLNKQIQQTVSSTANQNAAVRIAPRTVKPKIVVEKPKQLAIWPNMSYHGYIQDSKGEMVILKINAKMFRLRKNDLAEGITIKKISKDSLLLDFNNEKKILKRFKNNS